MKMKFTKASKNDGTLVTVSLGQFGPTRDESLDLYFHGFDLKKGEELVITIEGVPTIFKINRKGRTAATYCFPRFLKLPSVGRPVFADVTDVR